MKYHWVTNDIYLTVMSIYILKNVCFMIDLYHIVKYRGGSIVPGITLVLNIVYWIVQAYGYYFNYLEVWVVGLLLLLVDLLLCCYFHSSKSFSIHRTYNGILETALSIIRFFLLGKATRAFHIYWTAAMFPLTGYSIFSTFLFVFLVMQEIMILLRRKRNNEHAGKFSHFYLVFF